MSMQMTRVRPAVEAQQHQAVFYTLTAQAQQDFREHVQHVQTAQQALQKQAEQSSLSTAQAQRLKTMTALVSQTSKILEQCKQSPKLNAQQMAVIQQTVQLSKQLADEEQAMQLSESLAAVIRAGSASKDQVALSSSAEAMPQSTAVSAVAAAAASGSGDPSGDPHRNGKGDPSARKEPRSRWQVFKDSVKRYFTHSSVVWDAVLGAAAGGIFAIGTPVAIVTIPLTYAAIGTMRATILAIRLLKDPNGDAINKLYVRWHNEDMTG